MSDRQFQWCRAVDDGRGREQGSTHGYRDAVDAVDAAARSIGKESHAFTTQAHTMLFKSAIKSAFAAHAPLTRTNLAVGDSIPAGTTLVREFPNELVDMPARLAGKKTIVVGLPGAFTPT